ncbi:MAG: hypothetical protein NW205_00625 [Hyphomicrobiaceae bacterium]|nr:hypothetical protein [Hyphomicrobiaceae bacterium]
MIMSTLAKTSVLSAAVALVALTGGMGDAEAGKRKFGFGFAKHKHVHIHHFRKPVIVVHAGHGCGFYKFKWKKTGSYFWRNKYFDCIG